MGGAALGLGSVLFIVNKLNDMSRLWLARPMPDVIAGADTLLILVGQLALITGFVAYYQVYAARVGRAGTQALRLLCGGGLLLAVGHVSFMSALPAPLLPYAEFGFLFVLVGVLCLIVGLIWFGLLTLRQPVLGQWQWLPLATGLLGFLSFFLLRGPEITAVFLVFRTLFALGLIGLGITLGREPPLRPAAGANRSGPVVQHP